jgi:hypothetical protein
MATTVGGCDVRWKGLRNVPGCTTNHSMRFAPRGRAGRSSRDFVVSCGDTARLSIAGLEPRKNRGSANMARSSPMTWNWNWKLVVTGAAALTGVLGLGSPLQLAGPAGIPSERRAACRRAGHGRRRARGADPPPRRAPRCGRVAPPRAISFSSAPSGGAPTRWHPRQSSRLRRSLKHPCRSRCVSRALRWIPSTARRSGSRS